MVVPFFAATTLPIDNPFPPLVKASPPHILHYPPVQYWRRDKLVHSVQPRLRRVAGWRAGVCQSPGCWEKSQRVIWFTWHNTAFTCTKSNEPKPTTRATASSNGNCFFFDVFFVSCCTIFFLGFFGQSGIYVFKTYLNVWLPCPQNIHSYGHFSKWNVYEEYLCIMQFIFPFHFMSACGRRTRFRAKANEKNQPLQYIHQETKWQFSDCGVFCATKT